MTIRPVKITVALATALVLAACNPAAKNKGGEAAETKPPVAIVNGQPVTAAQLALFSQSQIGKKPEELQPEQKKQVIDYLVGLQAAAQEAEKQGLGNDPDTKARLDLDRTQVLFQSLVQKFLKDKAPTDAELKAEYDRAISDMPKTEYKARHILVKTEAEAKDVIAKLDKGAKFEDLAKAVSIDGSKGQGGELGWFGPGQMVKPFFDAVTKLEKGQTTKDPVQSEFGFHVIQLEDTRATTPPPFEQVPKDRLSQMVQNRKIKDYIDGLRKAAKVEIKG